jgi:hypothetical protein
VAPFWINHARVIEYEDEYEFDEGPKKLHVAGVPLKCATTQAVT